jgi:hypothetical protein
MNMQEAFQSQYLASLKMLKEAIVKCPPGIWNARGDRDRFWFKAQHALYWLDRYLRAADRRFEAWKVRRKPDPASPASKADLLEHVSFIEQQLRHKMGSGGLDMEKLELHIINIRHVQQHTGELYERLGSRGHVLLHWTEEVRRKNQ